MNVKFEIYIKSSIAMPLAWHYTNNGGLSVGVMGWTALRFGPDIHFYQSMNLLTL